MCLSAVIFQLLMIMNMMSSRQNSGWGAGYLTKLTCICCLFLTLVGFTMRPSRSASEVAQCSSTIPASLSHTLIHYATSNTTPQQSASEISVTDRVLRRKSPCNFLVFGLGHDSLMWAALNHGGRTLFLEEDAAWIDQIRSLFPGKLASLHVAYGTRVRHAEELLRSAKRSAACGAVMEPRESECPLALKGLPREVYEVEWDVIMVDAPTGFHDDAPGRMGAIYTAGLLARSRSPGPHPTDVMVHDVDRPVEDRYSMEFLCRRYFKEQVGRLRHFALPAARTSFCPS